MARRPSAATTLRTTARAWAATMLERLARRLWSAWSGPDPADEGKLIGEVRIGNREARVYIHGVPRAEFLPDNRRPAAEKRPAPTPE